MTPNTYSRILVIQTAFIGDAILVTSLLATLRKRIPTAHLTVMVRKGNEVLFADSPVVDEVLVWDKKENKYGSLWELLKLVRKHRYDLAINVQRYFSTGLFATLSGAGEVVGFGKNPMSVFFDRSVRHDFNAHSTGHEIQRNHALISWLVDGEPEKPLLHVSEEKGDDLLGRLELQKGTYVAISPASVWATKQYPLEGWRAIINDIQPTYRIVLLGGKGDQSFCQEILESVSHEQVQNLSGELGLLETSTLIKHAAISFTNDSAPLHMASATNAPVCAIFCSTLPSFGFGPLSERSCTVEVDEELLCRPCGMHGRKNCPEGHFDCARKIRLEDIKAKASLVTEGLFV